MARVSTYLNFPRNAEDVFNYYQSIFGGEFSGMGVDRFSDIPASEGGKITMDLQDMFWGAYYGNYTDKFGVQWIFSCAAK